MYKVIAKLLASRLAESLEKLISPEQGAFVKGRLMTENILLVQELLKEYKRKRTSPKCMIKIDIRKAYDTLSWSFLERIL